MYTDCPAGAYAEIFYKDCKKVKLEATEEIWPYCCIYAGCAVFCVENQSCSTDCFNLFAKGYAVSQGFRRFMQGRKSQ